MEEFRDIKGYEGMYKVSNYGRVKSFKSSEPKILKANLVGPKRVQYLALNLCKDGKQNKAQIHQLVAIAFLNHIPKGHTKVVNHIDFNRLNNHVSNLEIVTVRENGNKKHLKSSSKYTGVSWSKNASKWRAYIVINKNQVHLGLFNCELAAAEAYNKALANIVDSPTRSV